MKELKCKFCGKICEREGTLAIHERACSQNPESKNFGKEVRKICSVQESWKQENGLYKCPHCGKDFKKFGIINHIFLMHTEEGKEFKSSANYNMRGKKSWSKGLTKETSEILRVKAEKIKQKYISGELQAPFLGKHLTKETKQKIGAKLKGNHHNDPNKTGRGRKGYYKGFYCASTYELAYVIYCLDHGIDIQRCKEYFEYEYQGKKHRYYPDFVTNDEIVEIKGFWTELVELKKNIVLSQNKKYKILFPKDMDFIFKYIEEKYGKLVDKNISDLYE